MYTKPPVTYENGLESNIYSIANQICSQSPKPPCSYQLIMDHDVDKDIEFDLIKDFTLACVHILFGTECTPCDLSEEQYDKLNSYVKSVGYVMNVKCIETDTDFQFRISFDRYHSPKPNPFDHLRDYMS